MLFNFQKVYDKREKSVRYVAKSGRVCSNAMTKSLP